MGELLRRMENKPKESDAERKERMAMMNVVQTFLRHGHSPKGIARLLHIDESYILHLMTDFDDDFLREVIGA